MQSREKIAVSTTFKFILCSAQCNEIFDESLNFNADFRKLCITKLKFPKVASENSSAEIVLTEFLAITKPNLWKTIARKCFRKIPVCDAVAVKA